MGPIKKLSLFSALSIQSLISQTVLCNTPPPTLKICIIIFTNLWTMRWIALNTQKLSTVLYFGVGTIRTRRATQKLRTPIKSRLRLVEQRLAQLSVGMDQVREAPFSLSPPPCGHCPNSIYTPPRTQTGTLGHFFSGPI